VPKKILEKGASETISPELGSSKAKLGDNELQQVKQQEHLEEAEPDETLGSFSIQDLASLARSAATLSPAAREKLLRAEKNSDQPAAPPSISSLVQEVLCLEKAVRETIAHVRMARLDFDLTLRTASAFSVERTAELLSASESQVYRWTKKGELKATWLDSHPRYRPTDIQTFIDARTKKGTRLRRAKTSTPTTILRHSDARPPTFPPKT
jgi:hypothetical protein